MGRVGYALDSNDTFGVVGYGGPEQTTGSLGGAPARPRETGVMASMSSTITSSPTSSTAIFKVDYGHEDNAFLSDGATQANSEWFAAGLWLLYDFTDKVELAFRQDWLKDRNGSRTGATFGLPVGETPELYSSTLTLNLKPVDNLPGASRSSLGPLGQGRLQRHPRPVHARLRRSLFVLM